MRWRDRDTQPWAEFLLLAASSRAASRLARDGLLLPLRFVASLARRRMEMRGVTGTHNPCPRLVLWHFWTGRLGPQSKGGTTPNSYGVVYVKLGRVSV